jgi:hypothetical protein
MLYIAVDVHSKWMTVKGFDRDTGEVIMHDRVPNDRESLERLFSSFEGPIHGAMESGTNSWSVYRYLEPFFERLLVVDPVVVWGQQARRGAKTDGRDAMTLAIKLSRGELPLCRDPRIPSPGRAATPSTSPTTDTRRAPQGCELAAVGGSGLI